MAGLGHEIPVVTTLDGSYSLDTEDSPGHAGWSDDARGPAGHRIGRGSAGRHHGEILQGLWQPPAAEGAAAAVAQAVGALFDLQLEQAELSC